MGSDLSRINLLGCPIDVCTMSETIQAVEGIIAQRKPSQHCPVNAAVVVWMQENREFAETVARADIVNADGQILVWAAKLLGTPLPERVGGPDLMLRLIELAAAKGHRVYFLGAREGVGRKMIGVFRMQYPQIQIVGYRDGYFRPEEEADIVRAIRDSQADLLFVGLGTPQKDFFIRAHLEEMQVPFCMGVGGAFDIAAGLITRAPIWMQRAGLEWMYRLLQEPGRMWSRYLKTNSQFMVLLLKSLLGVGPKCRPGAQ